jgi:hypothetical protein
MGINGRETEKKRAGKNADSITLKHQLTQSLFLSIDFMENGTSIKKSSLIVIVKEKH